MRTNGNRVVAAVALSGTIPLASPKVTDYSIRRQPVALLLKGLFPHSAIRPADVPLFVAAQMCGAVAATFLFRWLVPSLPDTAKDILMPHSQSKPVRTYLFPCIHNAGHSQMAAALFNMYGNSDECCAISAGTQPAAHVHSEVVEVMREIGIDLSKESLSNLR